MQRSPDFWNLSGAEAADERQFQQQRTSGARQNGGVAGDERRWQTQQHPLPASDLVAIGVVNSSYQADDPQPLRLHGLPDAAIGDFRGRSEDEYRAWLTQKYMRYFSPYQQTGGMPSLVFVEQFAGENFGRREKQQRLLRQLDVNCDGRISWAEFFNFMTFRKKSEVGAGRRMLNAVVKRAAPAASKKERLVRREADEKDDPVPDDAYLEFYDCRPPPVCVPALLVAVWVFFFVEMAELNAGPPENRVTWSGGVPYMSKLAFCPARRHEAWRFVSYALLHCGWHHVVFNTALALLLGVPLELVHKAWRVAPIFLSGVLAGSLLSSVVEPSVTLLGASGGVYALIGAHYGLVVMNWEELQEGWLRCRENPLKFFSSGVFRLLALTCLVALDFGVALHRRYTQPSLTGSTSLTAHAAGLACGLLVGIPVLRNIDKKPWEALLFWIAIGLCAAFAVFAVLWNIFYPGYPTDIPCNVT